MKLRRSASAKSIAILGTRGYPSFYGGFETAVRKLVPHFLAKGWDVIVYNRSANLEKLEHAGLTQVHTFGLNSKSLSTLSYGFTSALHCIFYRPDVALIMNVANGFWLPLLKIFGIKTIVNVDGVEWHRGKWGAVAKVIFKIGARLTAAFADEIVVDSKEIGKFWSAEFSRNGHYIPYGGDEFPLNKRPRAEVSTLVYVARFVPENSIVEFLDSIRFLPSSLKVVVVGSPLDDPRFSALIDAIRTRHKNVEFTGHIGNDSQLFKIWSESDVYFHGHTVGGTNPALVQAMMFGMKIVAVDTVFNREVLGNTGFFVDISSEKIGRGIEVALAHSDDIGLEARKRALTKFSWGGVCLSYETLALQFLERRIY